MNNIISSNKNPVYKISDENYEEIAKICHAMSSCERIKILHLIETQPMTIKELAIKLNLPISSVTLHTNILFEAKLINIEYKPNKKGLVKLCSRSINRLLILFDNFTLEQNLEELSFEMPIGNFSEIDIVAPCGMCGKYSNIGDYDDLSSFYLPNRHKAELLWFSNGTITYKFPNTMSKESKIDSIEFSLEICSETLYSRNDWPSDITFWINDIEILTWTSPGDFGGRRGKYTPLYWFINSTQYGLLKTIKVSTEGVYLDDVLITDKYTINDLDLLKDKFISLKIGNKSDAKHRGGVNIFGRHFGDYPQAIIMKIFTQSPKEEK